MYIIWMYVNNVHIIFFCPLNIIIIIVIINNIIFRIFISLSITTVHVHNHTISTININKNIVSLIIASSSWKQLQTFILHTRKELKKVSLLQINHNLPLIPYLNHFKATNLPFLFLLIHSWSITTSLHTYSIISCFLTFKNLHSMILTIKLP